MAAMFDNVIKVHHAINFPAGGPSPGDDYVSMYSAQRHGTITVVRSWDPLYQRTVSPSRWRCQYEATRSAVVRSVTEHHMNDFYHFVSFAVPWTLKRSPS